MTTEAAHGRQTRLLFMGDSSLADGFRLIGFETVPNPEPAQVNRILRDLDRSRDSAFVIIDDAMMDWDVPMLAQLRREGGRIIVISLPPLETMPPRLSSDVAARLQRLFGAGSLSTGEET
ncbi:V-type ATP synthase subunit F [Thioalkalivibrio sp.]|uniref:V-type ATP synthase subunit F n=1 Tax=Thioalkalivibrio sp. TaxID=2093813 RepID=UPI0035622A49